MWFGEGEGHRCADKKDKKAAAILSRNAVSQEVWGTDRGLLVTWQDKLLGRSWRQSNRF